jgi:endonuclease/exonuclease/phosphatase family metal-dependent hydrolase
MTFIRFSRMLSLGTLLAACVLLASCNGKPKDGQQNVATATAAPKVITIASFNSLHLGWNNQKDTTAYCSVLAKYDVIGLVEAMNTEILDKVKDKLGSMTNVNWEYVASDKKLGRSTYKEYYAIMYRTDKTQYIDGSSRVWNDEGDKFEREPFIATFKSGNFDYTIVLIHTIFGDNISERRGEVAELGTLFKAVQDEDPKENDFLLMGDFNLPASDAGWQNLKAVATMQYAIPETTLTTLNSSGKLSSSYDNIWFQGQYTSWEYADSSNADYYYTVTFKDDPNPGKRAFKYTTTDSESARLSKDGS